MGRGIVFTLGIGESMLGSMAEFLMAAGMPGRDIAEDTGVATTFTTIAQSIG
jgi:hypothetical protein